MMGWDKTIASLHVLVYFSNIFVSFLFSVLRLSTDIREMRHLWSPDHGDGNLIITY